MYSAKKAKLCVTFYFKVFKPKTKFSFRVEEMSLPECEGPANSTLCFLPELLEELQKSETVRFQDFINVSVAAFTRERERWMLWGKQKNLKTSKFSTFGTQSILLPIQWWAQVRKVEVNFDDFLNKDCFLIEIKSLHCSNSFLWIYMIFSGNHSQQCCTSHCWAPVKKVWYDNM